MRSRWVALSPSQAIEPVSEKNRMLVCPDYGETKVSILTDLAAAVVTPSRRSCLPFGLVSLRLRSKISSSVVVLKDASRAPATVPDASSGACCPGDQATVA